MHDSTALALRREALASEAAHFTAVCPSCQQDAVWVQERTHTAVRTTIVCRSPQCQEGPERQGGADGVRAG